DPDQRHGRDGLHVLRVPAAVGPRVHRHDAVLPGTRHLAAPADARLGASDAPALTPPRPRAHQRDVARSPFFAVAPTLLSTRSGCGTKNGPAARPSRLPSRNA